MSYIETQRHKAIQIRDQVFNDPGGGVFKRFEREFILKDPTLNLFAGFRDDVIDYFTRNSIPFWDNNDKNPTGHLMSSQVACLNHLFFVRQREDIATCILQNIDKGVKKALILDDGLVEFEVVGKKNYLGEKSHSRGANSTSVDAVMLAEMLNGAVKLFFIEWKFVEQYKYSPSKALGDSGKTRLKIYLPLLLNDKSPIKSVDLEGLFTEPFYQMMRQTLLADEMIKAKEYGATEFLHVHIIPTGNTELKGVNTAAGKLVGLELEDTWTNILKQPERYIAVDPEDFLLPIANCLDTKSILNYLQKRYWQD